MPGLARKACCRGVSSAKATAALIRESRGGGGGCSSPPEPQDASKARTPATPSFFHMVFLPAPAVRGGRSRRLNRGGRPGMPPVRRLMPFGDAGPGLLHRCIAFGNYGYHRPTALAIIGPRTQSSREES